MEQQYRPLYNVVIVLPVGNIFRRNINEMINSGSFMDIKIYFLDNKKVVRIYH